MTIQASVATLFYTTCWNPGFVLLFFFFFFFLLHGSERDSEGDYQEVQWSGSQYQCWKRMDKRWLRPTEKRVQSEELEQPILRLGYLQSFHSVCHTYLYVDTASLIVEVTIHAL